MKKLVLILLPMLIIISLIFTIRDKNISWVSFIQFVKDLRFSNFISSINNSVGNLKSSVNAFSSISNANNIIEILKNIATGLSKSIIGIFYLIKSLLDLVLDIGNNLFIITDFLFGAEIRQ